MDQQQNLIHAKNLFFAALGIDIAASLIIGADSFSTIDALKDIESGVRAADDALLSHIDLWDSIANVLFATMIGVGLALVKWLNSCYRFASQTIAATGFKHESWTAAGWIIPILNLFKPYLILNEIYKAGSRNWGDGDDWKKQDGSFLLLSWWIFWAVIHLIGWIVTKQAIRDSFRDDLTLTQVIGLYDIQAWACVFSVAIAILWFIVAHNLTRRLIGRANPETAFAGSRGQIVGPATCSATIAVDPISPAIGPRPTNSTERLVSLTSPADASLNMAAAPPPSRWRQIDSGNDDHIYDEIARELETGATEKGLWIRLFAECDGDDNRTKVLYIKQRAEKLISAKQARLAEIAREQAVEAERLAMQQAQSVKEKELLAAVWDGNIVIVAKLLQEGVKPDHLKDEAGRSVYELAKERGDQQMIQLFQEHKKKSITEREPGKIVVKTYSVCKAMNDDSNIICTRCGTIFQD